MHLNQHHRKFVHRLLTGATAKDAYLHAFPDATPANARSSGPRLAKNPKIQAELTTLREKAESVPDADFLTYVEIRKFHARIVRACAVLLPDDSDLWNVRKTAKGDIHLRFPDKLRTLAQDAKLAGFYDPQNHPGHNEVDELADLLERVRDGETVSSTPSEIPPPSTPPTAFTEPQPPETSYFPPAPSVPETPPAPTEPDPTPQKNVRPTLSPREWVRLYGNPYKRSYGSSFFALLATFFLAVLTLTPAQSHPTKDATFNGAAADVPKDYPPPKSSALRLGSTGLRPVVSGDSPETLSRQRAPLAQPSQNATPHQTVPTAFGRWPGRRATPSVFLRTSFAPAKARQRPAFLRALRRSHCLVPAQIPENLRCHFFDPLLAKSGHRD